MSHNQIMPVGINFLFFTIQNAFLCNLHTLHSGKNVKKKLTNKLNSLYFWNARAHLLSVIKMRPYFIVLTNTISTLQQNMHLSQHIVDPISICRKGIFINFELTVGRSFNCFNHSFHLFSIFQQYKTWKLVCRI